MKIGIAGEGKIGRGLVRLCEKKKIEYILYKRGGDASGLSVCDLVIEAISENFEQKVCLYKLLIPHIKKDAVISTTTSSLSIEKLALVSQLPERFIGLHFFNPPQAIDFVEVIPSKKISANFLKKATDFLKLIKYDYVVLPDTIGFVANKLLFSMLLAAIGLNVKNKISKSHIDIIIRKSLRHPMGPFELLDFIGLDTADKIFCNLFDKKKLSVWKKYYEKPNR